MRFLLLALLVSMPALAQNRELKDLQYIPKAMSVYGETSLSQASYEFTKDDSSDVETKVNTFAAHQKLGLGLTDQLSVSVAYDHMLHRDTDSEIGGAQQPIQDQSGPMNPTVGATMRFLEQANSGWNLDGVAFFSPDLIESKSNSTKHESDAAQGGSSYTVGTRLGHKMSDYQSMYEAYVDWMGETSIKDKSTGTKSKDDAYGQLRLRGNWQTNVLPALDMRGRLGVDYLMERVNKQGSTKTTSNATGKVLLGASALFTVIPDQLLVTFDWDINMYMRYDQKVSGSSAKEIQDFRGFDLKLAAVYQF